MRTLALVTLVTLAALAAPGRAAAQSLLSTGGLGAPVEAVDARARALGGIGVGLPGGFVSAMDPSAAVDLRIPTVSFTSLSSWVDVSEGGSDGSVSGTRFPSMGIAYPAGNIGTFTLTFGGILDQRWTAERERTVELGGSTVSATDSFLSDGGLGAARLGWARRLAPSLGVGVAVGTLTGEVTRTFTRAFDADDAESAGSDYRAFGRWTYGGVTASAGAVVDVGGLLRASGALNWYGTLDAEPSSATDGAGRSFELPLELRVGATGVLAPGLSAHVGMQWADWSGVDPSAGTDPGSSTLGLGGGVEWSEARLLGKDAAIRVGYRKADLPFAYGGGSADESAWTGGLGLVLARGGTIPLAALDLSVERGDRNSDVLTESFWRMGLSLRLSGF